MQKKSILRLIIFVVILSVVVALTILGGISIPNNANLGLEFAGGTQIRLQVLAKQAGDKVNLAAVSEVLLRRVDSLGVSNPNIEIESSSGRINVTLAGFKSKSTEDLKNMLESSGSLTFNDSDGTELMSRTDFPKENAAYFTFDAQQRPAIGINFVNKDKFAKVTKDISSKQGGDHLLFAYLDFDGLVNKAVEDLNKQALPNETKVTARDVIPLIDSYCYRSGLGGVPYIYSVCRPHAISRATVASEITSNAILSGDFTRNEAQEIIDLINSGTIDYQIELLEVSEVSASYGITAFNSVLIASAIALAVVSLFLLFYYGIFGIIAVITMALFIVTSLYIFNQIGGEYSPDTMAAMIIGIGMAADTSIVTLERMKKEYVRKKTLNAAYLSSSWKSLATILDSNITTFITAFMLFWFGVRAVKGFSIMLLNSIIWTLAISVFLNRVLAYFLIKSHFLYERPYLFGVRYNDVLKYNSDKLVLKEPFFHKFWITIRKHTAPSNKSYHKFKKTLGYQINKITSKTIMDYAFIFAVISLVIILIGMAMFLTYQPNLGLDFTGGTRLDIVANKGKTMDIEEVSKVIKEVSNSEPALSVISLRGETHLIYRIQSSDTHIVTTIISNLRDLKYSTDFGTITATIANELVRNALIAIGAALVAIFAYCIFRFSWTYSLAAIIAIVHDVLIMLALITLFRVELRMNAVAAILAIIGYSINDTIVTFSRIQEEVKEIPKTHVLSKMDIKQIAERGVRATFKRSILTSVTTLMAVLSLLLFGPEATNNFSILMFIGLVSGTYSSIFIASFLWVYFHLYKMKLLKKRLSESTTELYGPDEQLILGINV